MEEKFDSPDEALKTFNLLVLAYKYLHDLNQIAFLMSRLLNIILRKQKKALMPSSDGLAGAWIIGIDDSDILGVLKNNDVIVITDELYKYVIYPTARAISALSFSKGISASTVLRSIMFLNRFLNRPIELAGLTPNMLVPLMDAIFSVFVSDILPYDKVQSVLLPLAERLIDLVLQVDPDRETLYTRDMLIKLKLMKGKGLTHEDAHYIGKLLEMPILRNVLKALLWLLKFGVEIPPMIPELLMDLLIENYGLVFDIHKNELLMYYISNAETLAEILVDYSDKKFAQIVLDRTVEYVAESVLQGVDDVYSAAKLLLIAKTLIEARAIIRR